jgi:transcription elongation factor Elf1
MNQLASKYITCPYCGENFELVVDCSIPEQEYIEDCEVCCRPINLFVSIIDNEVSIIPKHEND